MSAAAYSFSIEAGATHYRRIELTTSSGDPIDLTGYTVKAQVRETPGSETVLAEWSTANGRLAIPLPETGAIVFEIPAVETSGYTWAEGVWDMELTAPNGRVERLLSGRVYVDPEVTR